MKALTLDEIEKSIFNYYRVMTMELTELYGPPPAPRPHIQETGDLAALWALADREYDKEVS